MFLIVAIIFVVLVDFKKWHGGMYGCWDYCSQNAWYYTYGNGGGIGIVVVAQCFFRRGGMTCMVNSLSRGVN